MAALLSNVWIFIIIRNWGNAVCCFAPLISPCPVENHMLDHVPQPVDNLFITQVHQHGDMERPIHPFENTVRYMNRFSHGSSSASRESGIVHAGQPSPLGLCVSSFRAGQFYLGEFKLCMRKQGFGLSLNFLKTWDKITSAQKACHCNQTSVLLLWCITIRKMLVAIGSALSVGTIWRDLLFAISCIKTALDIADKDRMLYKRQCIRNQFYRLFP